MPRLIQQEHTFEDYINDFMIDCTNRELRTKTRKSYESSLKLFAKYLEEEKGITTPLDATTKDIKDYMDFTLDRGKYSYVSEFNSIQFNNPVARKDFGKSVSKVTINGYLRNIKAFYSYLFNNRIVKTNVAQGIKQLDFTRIPKETVTDEDFNRLLKILDLTNYAEYRDYVIIQLLIDTGMRIGETLKLQKDFILLENKSIFLPKEITKGRKDRYVYFGNKMQTILRKWLDYQDRYFNSENVFTSQRGNELIASNIEKNFKKYSKRAKLEHDITPHQLRNNFAKRFLLSGGDIYVLSKILGHSSVEVTQKAYLDVTNEELRKAYIHFSPLEEISTHKINSDIHSKQKGLLTKNNLIK